MTKLSLTGYEKKLQDSQVAWIRKRFGNKAAQLANYGWASDGEGKNFSLTTKVYGKGILYSSYDDDKIDHDFDDSYFKESEEEKLTKSITKVPSLKEKIKTSYGGVPSTKDLLKGVMD